MNSSIESIGMDRSSKSSISECLKRLPRRRVYPDEPLGQFSHSGFSEHVIRERELAIRIANDRNQISQNPPTPIYKNVISSPEAGGKTAFTPDKEIIQPTPASYEPVEWRNEPDFDIGFEWLGRTTIPPREMSRNWLILGETGCGKTRSGVIPLLDALIRYGY